MAKTLKQYLAPKNPAGTGFNYAYILIDNNLSPDQQVPLYAKMNEAATYNRDGAYEKVSKHIAEELQKSESEQRRIEGFYSPTYDNLTLNFMVRANLRGNPNIYFWNAEPNVAKAANKTMVMPSLYDINPGNAAIIKDAIDQSANRIVAPLGLKWPDPRRPDLDHMTALVIEPKSNPPKIFFFNPFGESDSPPVNIKYKQMADAAINKLKNEIPGLQNAEVINSKATLEYDGTSCAVWSEWFMSTLAAKSELAMSGFNDSLDLLRSNKREGQLNEYIKGRYESNKRNFSVPAIDILQKQAPQPQPIPIPQARPDVTPPVRPAPISDKWQRVGNVPSNLPFYRHNSYNSQLGTQYDTSSAKFFNVGNVKIPIGVYEKNSASEYQIVVSPHSVGAQAKTKNESLSDYRARVKQTMEFGADKMNLKQTGFEIASKSPFEDPNVYIGKLQIVLEEAARQNIAVKISAPDRDYLNSLYEKISQKPNRTEDEGKLLDTAKLIICDEIPKVAQQEEVQSPRFRR